MLPAPTDNARDPVDDSAATSTILDTLATTLGRCSGSFQAKAGPRSFPGRVTGVERSSLGDGGIAIRDEVRYAGSKPQKSWTAAFSVGGFVVQVDGERAGHGERIAAAIAASLD
ncbi:hypothetical protein Q9R29_12590 [Rothia sp. ARF10]|nr:hypothetical protein [Rothia sp. ARF10]